MKICIIFTGGTIGSRVDEDGRITTKGSSPYRLLELYQDIDDAGAEFVVEEPYSILSENLAAENIQSLIQCVNQAAGRGDIDGIIITHGTDTLQYSAALLGYLFGGMPIPIVLVSADYPLADLRSNGLDNFNYAVEFIRGKYGDGVFVSYTNKGDVPVIHRGTRLLRHQPLSADVFSVRNTWYGRFENGRYKKNPAYRVREGLTAIGDNLQEIKLNEFSGVTRISPCVGMAYPALSEETKAVLHESFHSGTIAISKELKRFAAEARERRIPIFLSGLSESENEYETVQGYRKLGVQPLCESSPVSQYCKLWLAVSNGINIDRIMKVSVAEDFI